MWHSIRTVSCETMLMTFSQIRDKYFIFFYNVLLGAGLGLYLCSPSQSALEITAALFSRPIDSRPVVQK